MPKERLRLDALDQSKSITQEEYKSKLRTLQLELLSMQLQLLEKKIPVIFLMEGPDAAGKGGTIKRVFERLDPRLLSVHSINKPTEEEFARHYMWRFWTKIPARGHTAVHWRGRRKLLRRRLRARHALKALTAGRGPLRRFADGGGVPSCARRGERRLHLVARDDAVAVAVERGEDEHRHVAQARRTRRALLLREEIH